jgi:hypothetical protein
MAVGRKNELPACVSRETRNLGYVTGLPRGDDSEEVATGKRTTSCE